MISKQRGRRKSRFGCRNCKLRKLKCDETKPQCTRCKTYGVVCNFEQSVPDLVPLSEHRVPHTPSSSAAQPQKLLLPPPARPPVSSGLWANDVHGVCFLDTRDLDLLRRFRFRTMTTLNHGDLTDVYDKCLLHFAFQYPFLMHGIMAVAAVHDRYLDQTPAHRRSLRECFHWYEATAQFSRWLQGDVAEEHKDPIWAAASMLGILALSALNVGAPEQVWPLRELAPGDLDWLRLGRGKMRLWRLVNPLRPGSVFRTASKTLADMQQAVRVGDVADVPPGLAELCGIDAASAPENNAYFLLAHGLAQLLSTPKGQASLGDALRVQRYMDANFEARLQDKDPIALTLLGLWYSRAREGIWWIELRASYELPAIQTYLRRHHGGNSTIQALLLAR